MLRYKILCLFFVFSNITSICAQNETYTYFTDRRFTDPSDLIGYNFKPSSLEYAGGKEQRFDAGIYSFGITQNNLYVKGKDIEGVYNVNNINPTEYGFKLSLINARDALIQGHLKIIQTDKGFVDALVFKRSNKEPEIIFHIADIPEALLAKEKAYFTDKNELIILDQDSLWDKTVRPFHRIHRDQNGIQQRLVMADSTSLHFFETITIIDKSKKKKDKDGKEEAIDSSSTAITSDSLLVSNAQADSTASANKNIKIIKKHFVTFKTVNKFEDGTTENEEKTFLIKNVAIKEDKKANAAASDDKYMMTISTDKDDVILYLNAKKAVSYFILGSKTYLVRGF